jgi:hypothetical protein
MNSKLTQISTYAGIFLFLLGISYYGFGQFFPTTSQGANPNGTPVVTLAPQKTGSINVSGPKIEVCPINGDLFTSEEKDIWSTRRPMAIMIENHLDSRPQSGLQNADIVYEAVAEGGITRFMGIFYCNAAKGSQSKYDVGPVRSARTYFLDLASEYADYPLYAHVGGANCSAATPGGPCTTAKKAQAIEQISQYGWNNAGTWSDLSQFSLSYKACRREPERTGEVRATEHSVYCSTTEMYNVAANRGLTNLTTVNKTSWDKNYRPWSFKQKDSPVSTDVVANISFDFWAGYKDYSVSWKYDSSTNRYIRSNNGQVQIDFNTQEPLYTKNLVVQYTKETRAVDVHGHLLYDLIGSGTGILYQNGGRQEITWSKANRISRTIYKDKSGAEVNFVPGMVWVEILPIGNKINYEGQS